MVFRQLMAHRRGQVIDGATWHPLRDRDVAARNHQGPSVVRAHIIQHEHGGDQQRCLRVLKGGAPVQVLVQRLRVAMLVGDDGLKASPTRSLSAAVLWAERCTVRLPEQLCECSVYHAVYTVQCVRRLTY
jgi:hypothetical protein